MIKFYENLLLGKNNNLHSKDLIESSEWSILVLSINPSILLANDAFLDRSIVPIIMGYTISAIIGKEDPVISLIGDSIVYLNLGEEYKELGAKARTKVGQKLEYTTEIKKNNEIVGSRSLFL